MVIATGAQSLERSQIVDIIAGCTGRMSAELEFAWLMSDPDANRLDRQRSRFVEILESLGSAPDPREVLALRIDTKMAHARLLTTAHFGSDAVLATWAKRQAVTQRNACQNMLLDS